MLEGDRLLTAMAYNIMKMHKSKSSFCCVCESVYDDYNFDVLKLCFLNISALNSRS